MSSILNPGDIAIVGFRSGAPDGLSFVTFKDLEVGTMLGFTDASYQQPGTAGSWRGTENFAVWTAATAIPAGTVVVLSFLNSPTPATSDTGATAGALNGISGSGDQVFVYQRSDGTVSTSSPFTAAATQTTWNAANGGSLLFGINVASTGGFVASGTANLNSTNTSYLPDAASGAGALTLGTTALNITSASIVANAQYNGARSGLSSADFKAQILNQSNWVAVDATTGALDSTDLTFASAPVVPTVNLSVSTATGSEAGRTIVTVTATASSAVTGDQTVSLGVSGTGITTGDYTLTSGTITIPSGATTGSVTFTVVDDAIVEDTETAVLTLSNPSAGVTLGGTVSQSFAIADNDVATPTMLQKVGGFTSANGAEIPAFDPGSDRLFSVAGNTVEILSVSSTGALALIGSLPPGFTAPAGTNIIPNSVAVKNGIVAVGYAVQNATTNAQQIGQVSFYNAADGTFLNSVAVGYLPDMLTFTPDGTKVLVANEGEPNSYGQLTSFDPEGSISVINLAGGVANVTVQNASFASFNSQIATLRASGVRITGPGSTVAQDLEPEYIAVAPDGLTARVTLQENNAIAILDIATASITDIQPLGLKNHNQPTVTGQETYTFTNLPVLGTTAAGQQVPLGGFSGLTFEGYAANGNLKFITHTDRGPNGEPTGINRPFVLPDFAPEIIRFELSRTTGQLSITQRIQLKDATGDLLSGLPNTAISTNANQPFNDEVPVDLQGNVLPRDPLGADLEGIVVAPDGTFWMVDEYRPAIYHFNSSGVLIDRFVPTGTAAAAGQPAGTFGTEVLPEVLGQRRQNRGFEGVAFQDGKVYAFVQSPIRNPSTLSNTVLNGLQNIRIVEFDPATNATRQFLYVMDNAPAVSATDTRADKIGDAVAIGNGEFLVLERDDDAIDSDPLSQIQKKVYRFSLSNATDISALSGAIDVGGEVLKTVDQMTLAELQAAGVRPINKTLHVDLAAAGYNTVEKVEGLTIIDRNTLAVINDNDFTVGGIVINPATGTFTPDPNAEKPVLGLITLQNNGLDASDQAPRVIDIRPQPVFGMYQPDAIASFTANGQTYYITANEGDARDYPGFAEEARVGAATVVLDPTIFPNAATLKANTNLGRLTISRATGDTDGDGDLDRLEALGSRSFSIWDSNGKQVFDSGDQLEQITAALAPTLFNSDGTAASFDTRSDNKGPEPEGVAIGVINNRTYAFIGLERVGDVIVYEVTNPNKPVFVQYINTPEDLSPEGLAFIAAADSPTGKALLATANEISRTVALFEVTPQVRISDIQGAGHTSPLNGQTVLSVPGIVTALASNGFYLEDPNPDSSNATSEGIFVFTSSAPIVQVGDAIQVSGRVSEFRPGGANSNNLTITQITAPTITTLSRGNALPAPTVLGIGGRAIPTTVIENDVTGSVEAGNTFDPASDGLDFYESLEGMRVQINNPVTTSPTANFGTSQEIWVLADNGANATSRTARGGSLINPTDFNPERIQIDDLNNALVLPEVNVGTQLSSIVGVVNYDFSNYEVLVSSAPTVVQASPLQKEVTNLVATANQLTVGTFNVENLDPGDGPAKFNALADAIVNNLKSPDILSLEEIQDNNGPTNDSVVDASTTYQTLINAIVAAGGPQYEFRQINPVDDTNGGEPGGNIRVGFLFNPNRVSFVDRSGGTSTSSTTVGTNNGAAQLSASPGLIDPTNPAFSASRKPLVGEFIFNGQTVFVVANHFNSKGGDQPLFGRFQPPVLSSEVQRNQQATIVKDFVQSILAVNPNANVVVAGDLNDFEFSNPLNILKSAGLTALIETLPQNERYTYNFEGNAQTLDHLLVSGNLLNQLDGFDVVHINSEFADQVSDHDPSVARFRFNSAPTAFALSGNSVNENVAANTPIGSFTTTDVDPGNTFTYTLVAGAGSTNNSAFTITNNQLQINLSPDFETQSSYSIRVRTTDQGGLSFENAVTIAVNNLNEAPVNSVPGGQTATQDRTLVFSAANGNPIIISDVDANNGLEQVTLSVTGGVIKLGSTNGLTVVTGSDNSANLTVTGSLSNLNQALNGLQFTPDAESVLNGAVTLTILTDDLGNTGAGGAKTDTDTIAIAVNPAKLIRGNGGNNTLFGSLGSDTIYAGGGNDSVFGLGGNDILLGEAGNDQLYAGFGNDYLDGGSGNDRIADLGGNNKILGGAGNDTILVGFGSNLIDGGTGNDSIYLSFGRDTIALARGNGTDTIYGYEAGSTRFSLSAGLTFNDLTIVQNRGNALIRAGGETLALVTGTRASSLTASSFV
jgi:predicted extracellular nuclease/uncharacterized protein YjiK